MNLITIEQRWGNVRNCNFSSSFHIACLLSEHFHVIHANFNHFQVWNCLRIFGHSYLDFGLNLSNGIWLWEIHRFSFYSIKSDTTIYYYKSVSSSTSTGSHSYFINLFLIKVEPLPRNLNNICYFKTLRRIFSIAMPLYSLQWILAWIKNLSSKLPIHGQVIHSAKKM